MDWLEYVAAGMAFGLLVGASSSFTLLRRHIKPSSHADQVSLAPGPDSRGGMSQSDGFVPEARRRMRSRDLDHPFKPGDSEYGWENQCSQIAQDGMRHCGAPPEAHQGMEFRPTPPPGAWVPRQGV